MNILFATLVDINSLDERGIYQDLMRELVSSGHNVFVVSPAERRQGKPTEFFRSETGGVLKVRVGNIQKTGRIEKGISTLRLESKYVNAVRKYLKGVKFDLIIYSTPPITLVKLVKFIKKRDGALSYLLLKDIFPQNAVDIGLLRKGSLLYKFFRKKELGLYDLSDYIGCMSPANVKYLLTHSQLDDSKVHVCPNSIEPVSLDTDSVSDEKKNLIRNRYGIAGGSKIFVYGGNLGRPQSVPFIIECLKLNQGMDDRFFLICGSGTDYRLLSEYMKKERPDNVLLLDMLPKDEYDNLLKVCDIGLIFLDARFTIPNFPSRLLSYMEYSIPVLACTDPNTDIGETIVEGGFGWWCSSDNPRYFSRVINQICGMDESELREMGRQGRRYLEENYLASQAAEIILEKVKTLC